LFIPSEALTARVYCHAGFMLRIDVVENSASSRKRFTSQPTDVSMNCAVYTCDLSVMLWYEDKGRLRPVTCHKDTAKGGGGGVDG
jgi:hypothetical protein